MIHEKSCGAVVYALCGEERQYLVEQMRGGHYALCKGHVEQGETEPETALREIAEETGLTVKLDTRFREKIEYAPFDGCRKEVIYFVACSETTRTVAQQEEVRAIHWAKLEKALSLLTYENDREILRKADEFLSSTNG